MSTPIAEPADTLAARFERRLAALRAQVAPRRLVVALSGGLDSCVLLHLAVAHARPHGLDLLSAHVDHRLQADSAAWAAHCAKLAAALGVAHRALVLEGAPPRGASLEAWAREARYAALGALLDGGGALLTAHHRDDQAETVMQRLLWRAGPHGLAGMPAARPLAGGWLLRPLLGEPRAALLAEARARGLQWLEDPSNRDPRHPRNRLRAGIMPALERSFPGAAAALAAAGALQGEVAALLDELADTVIARGQGLDGTLAVECVLDATARLRPFVLKRWLARLGAPAPGRAQLVALLGEVLAARDDAAPCVAWRGRAVRRYAGRLFLTAATPPVPLDVSLAWPAPFAALALPGGEVSLLPGSAGDLDRARLTAGVVSLRCRRGGERLRLHPGGPRRELKHLFQDWRVPPWLRASWPLLYVDDELAAVAGLAVAAGFRAAPGAAALACRWQPREV